MREWAGGAGRRWEEETGKERESDRKKGNSMGWGGRRLELRQRSQNSSLTENQLGRERGRGASWVPRP